MLNNRFRSTLAYSLVFSFLMVFAAAESRADIEINLDADEPIEEPTKAPAKPAAKPDMAAPPAVKDVPGADPKGVILEVEGEGTSTQVTVEMEPEPEEAKPLVSHGTLKMRNWYDAGIKAYKLKEYDKAIQYLEKAVTIQDPYTKDYYYAEAHAMLGVIYQFYVIRTAKACEHYKEALRIDPKTRTALKYRWKVCGKK